MLQHIYRYRHERHTDKIYTMYIYLSTCRLDLKLVVISHLLELWMTINSVGWYRWTQGQYRGSITWMSIDLTQSLSSVVDLPLKQTDDNPGWLEISSRLCEPCSKLSVLAGGYKVYVDQRRLPGPPRAVCIPSLPTSDQQESSSQWQCPWSTTTWLPAHRRLLVCIAPFFAPHIAGNGILSL